MATLVLGAAGSFALGPVGGYLGALAGAYIDNQYLFPLLFPQKPLAGPRIDDRPVQLASEGSALNWVIGPRNRVGGVVIWASETRAVEQETEVSGKGGASAGPSYYRYFVDVAIAVCVTDALPNGRINALKKIWGDAIVLRGEGEDSSQYESITVYRGDQTTPDPTMEAALGVGNTPAFIGTAYFVVKGLEMTDFGRIPNFTALVEQLPSVNLSAAIDYVMARYSFDPSEWDTSLVSQCFLGEVVSGPQGGGSALGPLQLGYAIAVQEKSGQLVFFHRGEETVVTAQLGDLAAREFNNTAPEVLQLQDTNDYELPRQVSVLFTSTDNDFQQGSEHEILQEHDSDNVVEVTLPITLEPADAQATAARMLWTAHAQRQKITERLPPSYIEVQEGDIVRITRGDTIYDLFVAEISRGANFVLEVTGYLTDQAVHTQTGVAQDSQVDIGDVIHPAETEFVVLDIPPLSDEQSDTVGMYFVICNEVSSDPWGGASLFSSGTEAGTYLRRADAPAQGTLGTVLQPPTLPAAPWSWDLENEIIVELVSGELSSCSEEECLAGTNRAAILNTDGEWEVFGFRDVTDLGDNQYSLTRLLRGVRGTEHAMTNHSIDQPFVLLSTASVGFWARGLSGVGTSSWFKAPAFGGVISEYDPEQVPCSGLTMRPFSPTHLVAVKGPSNPANFYASGAWFVVADATDNSFLADVGDFDIFEPGMWITTDGWASNNGRHKILSITGAGSKIIVDSVVYNETLSNVNFVEGSPNDIVVTWNRRSRKVGSLYSPCPLSADETPMKFRVNARDGEIDAPSLRLWEALEERVVYTQSQQESDGLTPPFRLTIDVRQVSTATGESLPAVTEILS